MCRSPAELSMSRCLSALLDCGGCAAKVETAIAKTNAEATMERNTMDRAAVRGRQNITSPSRKGVSNIRIFAVGSHVDEREARPLALRLDGHNVLVVLPSGFEFDVVAARAFAGQIVRAILGVMRSHIDVPFSFGSVALQHIAILLQLIFVERQNLGRSVVGLILEGHDFDAKAEARDVDIRAVVAAVGILLFQSGP